MIGGGIMRGAAFAFDADVARGETIFAAFGAAFA
jgi:hypothetical protein